MRAPGVPRSVQTAQSGQIGAGAQVVQIQARGGDRRVPHPGLDGHRIDTLRQPETRGRVPQIVDAPPIGR